MHDAETTFEILAAETGKVWLPTADSLKEHNTIGSSETPIGLVAVDRSVLATL